MNIAIHTINGAIVFASTVFAITEAVGAAIVAGFFSILNTVLLLVFQRLNRETHEEVRKRRTVIAKIPREDGEETLVVTPEDRRALEDRRAAPRPEGDRRQGG